MRNQRNTGLLRSMLPLAFASVVLTGPACRSPAIDESRWACGHDADCMNSCRLGAVNAAWYRRSTGSFTECEDGCANQIAAPPRCIDGSCVAFQTAPSNPSVVLRSDHCTKKR